MQEVASSIPGLERSSEVGNGSLLYILDWKIPWTGLAVCSPWGCEELNMTEHDCVVLNIHILIFFQIVFHYRLL